MALRKPAIASGTVGAAGALRRSGGETAWRRLLHLRGALRRVRGAVGILCLVAAMLLTPAVDGVAKVMADTNGPATISFLRYLAAGLLGLAVARGLGRPIAVPRGDRLGLVVRTGLIMGAMTALIAALARVPMAEAVGGFLIAPVVSGLLGLCFWGERLTLPRLGGMAVSLIGAVTRAAAGRPVSGSAARAVRRGPARPLSRGDPWGADDDRCPFHPHGAVPARGLPPFATGVLRGTAASGPAAPWRCGGTRHHIGHLPRADRRGIPADGGNPPRALLLFQHAHGGGGRLRLLRGTTGPNRLDRPRRHCGRRPRDAHSRADAGL